jgi:deoxycytidylate deaminase
MPKQKSRKEKIEYPYLPKGREILYVPLSHRMMKAAKRMADNFTGCSFWPTGAVVAKKGKIIGKGANSGLSFQPLCPRIKNKAPTGTGYESCFDICKQDAHAEITSINNAVKNGNNPAGADLYLYGHWWCCKPCWDHIIKHKIKNVYLLNEAHYIFTRVKRAKLMASVEKMYKNGKNPTIKDVVWTLTKSKVWAN